MRKLAGSFQFNDGVFEQRAFVALPFGLPLDHLTVALLRLFQPDQVQQLGIKTRVQAVAVGSHGEFEQVRGRQDFVQRQQGFVVGEVIVVDVFLVGTEVEVGKGYLLFERCQKGFGNFIVKQVVVAAHFLARGPGGVLFFEPGVAVKHAVDQGGVEDIPLVHVGNDAVPQVGVAVAGAFLKVVEQQLMESLGIQVVAAHHFALIGRTLHLKQYPRRATPRPCPGESRSRSCLWGPPRRIAVVHLFQEIHEVILHVFLRFLSH